MNDTVRETLLLFREGKSPDAIAAERGLAKSTILGHLARAVEAGEPIALDSLVTPAQEARITEAFAVVGTENLKGAVERLGEGFDYGLVRLFRATRRLTEKAS